MGVYLGGQSVGPIVTVVTDEDIVNSEMFSISDLIDANLLGGALADPLEYKKAEELFQILAQRIMGGTDG